MAPIRTQRSPHVSGLAAVRIYAIESRSEKNKRTNVSGLAARRTKRSLPRPEPARGAPLRGGLGLSAPAERGGLAGVDGPEPAPIGQWL